MNFISIGGWCGTKLSLKDNGYNEPSYPFDYVRCSLEGVIDCIENDFKNYFPEKLERINEYITCDPKPLR
jgi:hypothetical protein